MLSGVLGSPVLFPLLPLHWCLTCTYTGYGGNPSKALEQALHSSHLHLQSPQNSAISFATDQSVGLAEEHYLSPEESTISNSQNKHTIQAWQTLRAQPTDHSRGWPGLLGRPALAPPFQPERSQLC